MQTVILKSSEPGAAFSYDVGKEKRWVKFSPSGGFTAKKVQMKNPDGTPVFEKVAVKTADGGMTVMELVKEMNIQEPVGDWIAECPTEVTYVDDFKRTQVVFSNLAKHLLDSHPFLEAVEIKETPEIETAPITIGPRKKKEKTK